MINMYCKNCEKVENEENTLENRKQMQSKCNKILSNKIMLIMFLINHILSIILMLNIEDCNSISTIPTTILGFIFISILMTLTNPFYLISIILCFLNIKNYKKVYVICCLIFSILMLIPIFFINLFLSIENLGIFSSTTKFLTFIIQSLLLILTCLFKLIFNVKL